MASANSLLFADSVCFAYPKGAQIGPLSLTLQPGRIHVLLGENGSGKSTFLRLLTGETAPNSGTIECEGTNLTHLHPEDRAMRIALVPQDEETPFGFTVEQIVLMGRAPWVKGLWETEADHAAADQALEDCDLSGLRTKNVSEISGGEKHRVLIARALAQNPRFLLLDEPTSSLDVRHKAELSILLHQQREAGLALLVTTHDLHWAQEIADDLTLIRQGKVVTQGSKSEALSPESLAETFGVPFRQSADGFWMPGTPQR